MNFSKAKRAISRVIPQRFRKPTLMEQRTELRSLQRKILANQPLLILDEAEKIARKKGRKSNDFSALKSSAALRFTETHFKVKLTLEQKQQVTELMAKLEERERAVKSVKKRVSTDELSTKLRLQLKSIFPNRNDYNTFIITYRLYDAELNQIMKKSGL